MNKFAMAVIVIGMDCDRYGRLDTGCNLPLDYPYDYPFNYPFNYYNQDYLNNMYDNWREHHPDENSKNFINVVVEQNKKIDKSRNKEITNILKKYKRELKKYKKQSVVSSKNTDLTMAPNQNIKQDAIKKDAIKPTSKPKLETIKQNIKERKSPNKNSRKMMKRSVPPKSVLKKVKNLNKKVKKKVTFRN
jgi:hypothetical protein